MPNLQEIKSRFIDNPKFSNVNIFCVVGQFLKTLGKTSRGKFTIIIEAVDPEIVKDSNLVIHFFTKEDDILRRISQGDVLRLNGVKLEWTLDLSDVDGRVFSSTHITLFKLNLQDPISILANFIVSAEEKRKANAFKHWFKTKHLPLIFENTTQFSDINTPGTAKVFGRVVEEPHTGEDGGLRIRLTDGSLTRHLSPALTLGEGDTPVVTEINVLGDTRNFSSICVNDYIVFKSVLAVTNSDSKLTLKIEQYSDRRFFRISEENPKCAEIDRKLEQNNVKVVSNTEATSAQVENNPSNVQPLGEESVSGTTSDARPPPREENVQNVTLENSSPSKQSKTPSSDTVAMLDKIKTFLLQGDVATHLITRNTPESSFQCHLFLDEIIPNPTENALSVVVGFCRDGCQTLVPHDKLVRREAHPCCPLCPETEHRLEMMFLFQLIMFDVEGRVCSILAFDKEAEYFLGCTAAEYVTNAETRELMVKKLQRLERGKHNIAFLPVDEILYLIDTRIAL